MFKFTFPNSPTEIQTVKEQKHLGVRFDSSMSWSAHVDYINFVIKSAVLLAILKVTVNISLFRAVQLYIKIITSHCLNMLP